MSRRGRLKSFCFSAASVALALTSLYTSVVDHRSPEDIRSVMSDIPVVEGAQQESGQEQDRIVFSKKATYSPEDNIIHMGQDFEGTADLKDNNLTKETVIAFPVPKAAPSLQLAA